MLRNFWTSNNLVLDPVILPALDPETTDFPCPSSALAQPDGLLAVGGALTTARLVEAYRLGIFPWYSEGESIMWWSPSERAIITPDSLHTSRSLQRTLNKEDFSIRWNTAFKQVVHACAAPRSDSPGTWIVPEMQEAYIQLHQLKAAHSIEVWKENELIGGIYGIALGPFFFGESMFSKAPNGSKIALTSLIQQLGPQGLQCLDCQMMTDHLESLGAIEEPRTQFLQRLHTGFLDEKPHNKTNDLQVSKENQLNHKLIQNSVLNIYLEQA